MVIETTAYTDKQKYKDIRSYVGIKYEHDKFEVSYIKLCLSILFPECIFNSEDNIEDAIDGLDHRDNGIDAYLVDHESKIINICQFKTQDNENKTTIAPKDLSYFYTLGERMLKCFDHCNNRVLEVCADYRKLLEKGYTANFYFITSYNLSNPDRLSEWDEKNYYIKTLDDIYEKYTEFRSSVNSQELPACNLEFYNQVNKDKGVPLYQFSLQSYGTKKTTVGIVTGLSLIKIYKEHKKQLFNRNVRYFLGNRGINKEIIKTAIENPTEFYYYNNGISLTCSEFEKAGDNILKLDTPQIINGAQTVSSIYEAYLQLERKLTEVKLKEHFGKLFVMTRIIQTTKSDATFSKNVTRYNNTQNKILDQDFFANDEIQNELHKKLLSYGYFYENKRNEFEVLENSERKKLTLIKLGDLTPIYDAFKNQNSAAGSSKKELFKEDHFKNKIFTADTILDKSVKEIVFVHNMHTIIKDLKKQLGLAENKKDFTKASLTSKFTLSIDTVLTKSYIDAIRNPDSYSDKIMLEKMSLTFDAIKQPYVLLAIISVVIKKHDMDISTYFDNAAFYEMVQKSWLKEISRRVYEIFEKHKSIGDNIINFYKSNDLVRFFKEYIEEQRMMSDKEINDLFPRNF